MTPKTDRRAADAFESVAPSAGLVADWVVAAVPAGAVACIPSAVLGRSGVPAGAVGAAWSAGSVPSVTAPPRDLYRVRIVVRLSAKRQDGEVSARAVVPITVDGVGADGASKKSGLAGTDANLRRRPPGVRLQAVGHAQKWRDAAGRAPTGGRARQELPGPTCRAATRAGGPDAESEGFQRLVNWHTSCAARGEHCPSPSRRSYPCLCSAP
jgi:hypothetical protein